MGFGRILLYIAAPAAAAGAGAWWAWRWAERQLAQPWAEWTT